MTNILNWERSLVRTADLTLDLRIIGQSEASLHIASDEGDGIEIFREEGEEPEAVHLEEWADQLEYIVRLLRSTATSKKE